MYINNFQKHNSC